MNINILRSSGASLLIRQAAALIFEVLLFNPLNPLED